ncbi:putative carbonic anhydrase 5 [Pectinophora gossypiella]|uniref:putative carbonic anhydrase 5 n=1 Tax=Pectinophora gossypiella TaxID=13191 RepID=UPI00214E4ADC|nr:putative carbonic anhydrase 5 [Pectinophora gossypiella]
MNSFVIIASIIGLAQGAQWSYDYETQWPGVCRSGTQQSPINIMTQDALVDKHGAHIRGPLQFRGYSNVHVEATNNGHTLKWSNVIGTPAPTLSGGPLRGNYTFLQFHLHWLSEHAIDGMKYPLEIHMVHIKTGLTLEEALSRDDGLTVIGVMCELHTGPENEDALKQIMPDVPSLVDRNENPHDASFIDLSRLLSPNPQSYYTYHGSLTTPQCQEAVTWIVMDQPLHISDNQYKQFSKVDVGGMFNYRSLQPVNRVVYRSVASGSSIVTPGLLTLLVSTINGLASNLYYYAKKGKCLITNAKKKIITGIWTAECPKLLN